MDLPRFVYRPGGPHMARGRHYSMLHVTTEAEFDAAMLAGWMTNRDAALFPALPADPGAWRPMPYIAKYPVDDTPPDTPSAPALIPPDDAPPTRAEMEQRALDLGIRLDRRWSDRRLLAEIAKAGE